jgi:hypothetical protein
MVKFLLVCALIAYVLYKFGTSVKTQRKSPIDFNNQNNKSTWQNNPANKNKGKFDGGEYIDYEEVK